MTTDPAIIENAAIANQMRYDRFHHAGAAQPISLKRPAQQLPSHQCDENEHRLQDDLQDNRRPARRRIRAQFSTTMRQDPEQQQSPDKTDDRP